MPSINPSARLDPKPSWSDLYWNNDNGLIYKTFVIAREALIAVAAVGLFIYNPPLFAPLFFAGMILKDPLDAAFKHISNVYKMAPVLFTTILFVGAILAFPASAWIACGLIALWAGKRVADLGDIYVSKPNRGWHL